MIINSMISVTYKVHGMFQFSVHLMKLCTGSAFTRYFNHNKIMSVWFHLVYLEIISHSLRFLWIQIHENSKKKIS